MSTFELRVTPCRNVSEQPQIEALKSRFPGRDVIGILPTAWLWEDLNLSSVLFGKAYLLQPDCERASDFAAQQHRPGTTL